MTVTADPCWLRYEKLEPERAETVARLFGRIVVADRSPFAEIAAEELAEALTSMTGVRPKRARMPGADGGLVVGTIGGSGWIDGVVGPCDARAICGDGFVIRTAEREGGRYTVIAAASGRGLIYGAFHLLRLIGTGALPAVFNIAESPRMPFRLLNHWDNLDGSVERGYAGRSLWFDRGRIVRNTARIETYARLIASVGINGVVLNNVNVGEREARLITEEYLPGVARLADVFRRYGVRIFLSVDFSAPVSVGGLSTADPLDDRVRAWWRQTADGIYRRIPDFGGFLVKADSEFRPGPFTYGRDHADGANMLADALAPHGGLVVWRAFVYNCRQDWRDRTTDRARAAYDHFRPLDGRFRDNVVLQIKNGPMDFQVREPVSPLFGAMPTTNQMLELQITQEYTGQQRHLCFLVPQWKEVLDFDTYARGPGSTVARVVDGSLFGRCACGIAGVANVGDAPNWTGHDLAQANLYGFGRLAWNPDLQARSIAEEWTLLTFGRDPFVRDVVVRMLLDSWRIYENYTTPLGLGWMVNPGHHYGPNPEGYEYSPWGTYHRADREAIGVDRSVRTGTGFAGQYFPPNAERFESPETCPEELLLFFHRLPYTYRLRSGKTLVQHMYDAHFEGAEQAAGLVEAWSSLRGRIDEQRFVRVLERLKEQAEHAKEWRDVINSYFWRRSGIPDEQGRPLY